MSESDRAQLIEKLESAHSFPGSYTFRVIGENHPDFPPSIEEALSNYTIQKTTQQRSNKGNHLSVRVTIMAPSPEAVLKSYEALSILNYVKYVL